MNKKPVIIFDFDGTLANTLEIFKNIYNSIAPVHGAKQIDDADIERVRDGQDTRSLLKEFGISYFKLPRIIKAVRKQFKMHIGGVAFHPGIKEMILSLKKEGYTLGILSSNSKEAVNEVLVRHGLDHAFDFVYSNKKIFQKEYNLKLIMKKHNLTKDEVIYVGDETRDIYAANTMRIRSIGVGWGFQTIRVLIKEKTTVTIEEPIQMVDAIAWIRKNT